MSMYPSLEDMKVDQLERAQVKLIHEALGAGSHAPQVPPYPLHPPDFDMQQSNFQQSVYPSLGDYMGLEFTPEIIAANMPEYMQLMTVQPSAVALSIPESARGIVAPLSGVSSGLQKAQVTNAIREVTVCKGSDGKIGLRVKEINKGVFVSLVKKGTPAAMAGLRFGDQILQINNETVAGYSMEKVHAILRKCTANGINMAVRDRPFERAITLHKSSSGHIGFQFHEGEITALVKESSAARNGLLVDHYLLEVNGQNVVGVKDKEVINIIAEAGQVVTVTVMPAFVYKHMMKHMSSSLVTKFMDHSVPDL